MVRAQKRHSGPMYTDNFELWERFAPLVRAAEKPSRYLGQEWGSIDAADKPEADYHAVMIYPDTYEIGQANQAVAILYDRLNRDPHILCERAFLPWVDMISLMRAEGLPLASLETYTPLAEFDFIGITLPHELAAANVLEVLDLGGVPLHASERAQGDPFVFGGGPCAFNPEPFSAFFDAFFIGEGEELDLRAALLHRTMRDAGASREEILRELAHIPGVYVPQLYELRDRRATPKHSDVPAVIEKQLVQDFDASDALGHPIVPYSELVHDRLAVEILRGCNRGCRFCQAGMVYRPTRERSLETLKRYADEVLLSYDSDTAGVKAALRAIPLLQEAARTGGRIYEDGFEPAQIDTEEKFLQYVKACYHFFGFGVWTVLLKPDTIIGWCGLYPKKENEQDV